jgi:outer membrane protein TolC
MKCLSLLLVFCGAAVAATGPEAGPSPHSLTLEEALTMALERNGEILVERDSVAIADANVARAEAVYEPAVRGDARLRRRTDPVNSVLSGAPAGEIAPTVRAFQSSASMTQLLPTGGSVSLFTALNREDTDNRFTLLTPSWSTLIGAEVRQPLLQNRRIDPARRSIRIARVDRSRADAALRRVALDITARVEAAYWNLAAARAQVGIRQSAIEIAERHREDTRVRIEAGTVAEADLAQTTAEVERRRGDLASAIEARTRAENALKNLVARDAHDPLWNESIEVEDVPGERPRVNLQESIERAWNARPELEELALRLDRQDVEIDAALDRVRPQVDLVAAYSGRGLAGSENEDALSPFGTLVVPDAVVGGLDRSLGTLGENRFPDASLGVSVSLPIGNTAAKQDVAIARALRRQSATMLDQVRQRVAVEVRNAVAAVNSAAERIDAARAARVAAEVALQAERDRFEAGTSNTFFLITRQNELAAAQLAEVVALADSRKAHSELARATGGSL